MNNDPVRGDVDTIIHVGLAAGALVIVATCFVYLIPELFDLHSTMADLAAIVVAGIAIAFGYLTGRHLWRSYRRIRNGDRG